MLVATTDLSLLLHRATRFNSELHGTRFFLLSSSVFGFYFIYGTFSPVFTPKRRAQSPATCFFFHEKLLQTRALFSDSCFVLLLSFDDVYVPSK